MHWTQSGLLTVIAVDRLYKVLDNREGKDKDLVPLTLQGQLELAKGRKELLLKAMA